MWIAIEGPTCSGKSTLYDGLNKRLTAQGVELETVHMDRPEELTRRWVLNEYVNRWENKPDFDTSILADRWHFGEFTYAPIYRPDTNKDGYGLLGKAGWRWTELFLLSRGAVTIQTTAPMQTLFDRLEERGDDHVRNRREMQRVARRYEQTERISPSTMMSFDTASGISVDEMVSRVIQLAEMTQEHTRELQEFPRYIGPRLPAVLLVGDTRNITKKHGVETHLPFMPVDGNSGEFLLNSIPDRGWETVGLVNGSEEIDLHELWITLGRPLVAALGANAHRATERALIPSTRFPHPQWARRFRNKQQAEYGRAVTFNR